VKVKNLAQAHNTESPASAWTWTLQSGHKHTNHEAAVPPEDKIWAMFRAMRTKIWIYKENM